ncbi:hypothetical protein [Pedobacter sp. L105]|uniref:hypothetical protein n=1 Tax=Pedobacter sp. L105 TaxID=1641871 RepID=UPI00131C2A5E|nr:hypothetical protein [Pedobacter sp. L105]
MIKAAALYLVIIISLMIAVISASLLSIGFYYRLEHQKKARLDRLNSNLESGTAILLSPSYTMIDTVQHKDLYSDGKDSVLLQSMYWGVFQLNTVKTFELRDTLQHSFLTGLTDNDAAAIYLADEDRPLSLSGDTRITGDGELPKSGLKQSYVDGKSYTGKTLITGKIKVSTRDLPGLEEKQITELIKPFTADASSTSSARLSLSAKDSVFNSFFNPVLVYQLKASQKEISGIKLKGKVVLISDTTLTLDQDLTLEDVLIYAPAILVKDGFKGSCQLFARDSIIIGKNCDFLYPSFAGVFKPEKGKLQSKIVLGQDSHFAGTLLSYEKTRSDLQTMISLGKGTTVKGEVYATGYIKLEAPVSVYGKVYAKRFLMQKSFSLYENYLIDVVLNRNLLSKYYLSSFLLKNATQDKQVLKWLN